MNIIPKIQCRVGENGGVEVLMRIPELSGPYSFLSDSYAVGITAITVDDASGLAADDKLVVGEIGSERAEIRTIDGIVGNVITLKTALAFAHNKGEVIRFTPFDKIKLEKSVDGGTNFVVLATLDIMVNESDTYYQDLTGLATHVYRFRFSDSAVGTTFSHYSDIMVGSGYAENSAGSVIHKALVLLGQEIDDSLLTREFLYESLNELRREIDEHKNIIRWPFRTAFDYELGAVIPGTYKMALPTNLRNPGTNQNVLSVRIGKSNVPLSYATKQELNAFYRECAHSTLNGAVIQADVEIVLDSSGDFDDTGAISVAASAVSESIDEIAYTGNTLASNKVTGVTGIQAAGHATGKDVWQGAVFARPTHYTIDNGEILFSSPFANELAGENIYLDYYKTITDINSDADLLDEPFYAIFISGLKWKIKLRKNAELVTASDADYLDWKEKREAQVLKNYTGQNLTINIDI